MQPFLLGQFYVQFTEIRSACVSWIRPTVLIAVVVCNNVKWAATFHKKTLFLCSIIQTTHTEKQINCLKPLKHMALCLIHNKQNISPICCWRAKRRVRKFKKRKFVVTCSLQCHRKSGGRMFLSLTSAPSGVITIPSSLSPDRCRCPWQPGA